MSWNKVTLVGVGLLGGSLGLALRTRKLAETVVGWVRREASIGEATQAGAVDAGTLDVREAVEGADLILVCTPVSQMVSLVDQCRPYLRDDVLITDVGSVKRTVVREYRRPEIALGTFKNNVGFSVKSTFLYGVI